MNAFLREETITLAGCAYTWRPSIAALCELEAKTKQTIFEIIELLQCNKADDALLRVLANAVSAEISNENLQNSAPEFLRVLKRAMGCEHMSTQPDWRDLFMTYVGVMGRTAAEFWDITLAEYALATAGFCLRNELDMAATGTPATSRELLDMMKQFPDYAILQ